MLQSTVHGQNETHRGHTSRNGHVQPAHAYSKDEPRMENRSRDSLSILQGMEKTTRKVLAKTPLSSGRQKTIYKLVDIETGLFCQGGPWPCAWDAVGKTWSSKSALRRHLRGVLSRGYHLKPRPVPPQWTIVEIEEIVSYHEKDQFPADLLIAGQ